jgi:WD40 repeat protein
MYPDEYWTSYPAIDLINKDHALRLLPTKLVTKAPIYSMALSHDGTMIAAATTLGLVQVFDVDTGKCLRTLRDEEEAQIEEFWALQFTPDDSKVIVAGTLKNRHVFSEADDDCKVEPSPVKIFDLATGKLLLKLNGHEEEIIALKLVIFDKQNYILTGSNDGRLIKWKMNADWSQCESHHLFNDLSTNVVLSVAFVPDAGNKFFVVGGDDCIKVFDFEEEVMVQSFPDVYTSYCDCVKFVKAINGEHYLLTRGSELVSDDSKQTTDKPNTCHIRKLTIPDSPEGKFQLSLLHTFEHEAYKSNIWPVKIATNGRYVLAPTSDGKIFIWNLLTGGLSGILSDHDYGNAVRDVLFHPYKPLLFTCADDATINMYTQGSEVAEVEDTGRRRRTTANKDTHNTQPVANGQTETAPKKPKGKVGRPRGSKKNQTNSLAASTNSVENDNNNNNLSTTSLLASTESIAADEVMEDTPNLQANENLEIQSQIREMFRASTQAGSDEKQD